MAKLITEHSYLTKYQDTDVDELILRFNFPKGSSLVDEYDLPKEYNYIVMTSMQEDSDFPNYVTVANPEGLREVINKDDKCLPHLVFDYEDDKDITLIEFFKRYIFEMI